MTYLILRLKATKANMVQSIGVLAPTPVFAAVMAMHALDKRMHDRLSIRGVGLVHHDYTPWMEHIETQNGYVDSGVVQRRGLGLLDPAESEKGRIKSPSIQPEALADYDWTLVLDCKHAVSSEQLPEIRRMVSTMRFAGGTIVSVAINVADTWDNALRRVAPGYWIEDVSDQLKHPTLSPMAALMQVCTEPWTMPSTLGYAMLTNVAPREGARDAKPHAFVEGMLGAVRMVPLRRVRSTLTPKNLWRYGWDADQFIVTNRDIPLLPEFIPV